MLIRGGENVYSLEVESALMTHPAVMDAGRFSRYFVCLCGLLSNP